MAIAALIVSMIGLALLILGLIVKVTRYMTKTDMYVNELRRDRKLIRRIPHHEYRLQTIEGKLDISAPDFVLENGRDEE